MKVLRTITEVREALRPLLPDFRIGLVPTMGAFHAGHLALFHEAHQSCDVVVVSLFVNPHQFRDGADLAAYPRDEEGDVQLAKDAGVDFLFAPAVNEMYPPGHVTWIDMAGPAKGLEGDCRPGHFRGVASVCLKLFTITGAQAAFFGQKDAQQVAVVRRLVTDFNLDVEICVVPTARDVDGLALSSRNVRLSPAERARARAIPRALEAGLAAHWAGGDPVTAARNVLSDVEPDYVAIAEFDGERTLAIAARVGTVRLIDNVRLEDHTTKAES